MHYSFHSLTILITGGILAFLPIHSASAQDSNSTNKVPASSIAKSAKAAPDAKANAESATEIPEHNLLDAMQKGLVSVQAEGTGDGRITMAVTNRTSRRLRVIMPPGIVAQGATGQFGGMGGGMGGMGGGGMGGMGGGGMGGMGGGGMGGMGGGGMGGGMGGMGRSSGTMPPMMGMMMLSNIIMYFCGDADSWDRRSLMMGMGGGGMMGGMGGMGGGMGGGMMGGMGGGMRSIPPSDPPFAELKPRQTRQLPTSVVSLTNPEGEPGLVLPAQGEKLRIVGDVARVNDDAQVQKTLRRLARGLCPASVSQLVMWRVAGGLDWATIGQLSDKWANRYELTLARDFVDQLGSLPEGESGHILFQFVGTDSATESMATDLSDSIKGKTVIGLQAVIGVPSRPDRPAVACQVRLKDREALVQVSSSDSLGQNWVPFGKFTLPTSKVDGKFDTAQFADALAEGS